MSEPLVLDLNTAFPGKPNHQTFAERVAAFDWQPYVGQRVQLRGCAPTWAHLLVAARLLPLAAGVDFLIDDGKGGVVVPIAHGVLQHHR